MFLTMSRGLRARSIFCLVRQAGRERHRMTELLRVRKVLGSWDREGNVQVYLLSYKVGDVGRFHLERAIFGPEVNRVGDAGATSLVDNLGRFGPSDVELEVGVLLPVAKQEGEFEQEAVVRVAKCS